MAVYDQIVTTYSDTTPHMRVISNTIQFIDPRDTPLLDYLGGLDAAKSKFDIGGSGTKIEILEDEFRPLTSAIADDTDVTDDSAVTSFDVADASVFHVGDVLLASAEYLWVSAADVTNNTVTVVRGFGGTQATLASDAAITIVGQARLEGADASYGPIVDITAPYNYTNIFEKGLKVTGTVRAIDQYGISDELAYQAAKAMPEQLRLVERMLFYGARNAGSATAARSAGGLEVFVTTNSINAGGTVVKADYDGAMEKAYGYGGFPDVAVMNHAVAKDLKDVIDTSAFVRFGQDENRVGTAPVANIVTQFGQLNVLMDRHCPVARSYVLQSDKVGVYTLRPFAMYDIAKSGDSDKVDLVGELSFLVANDAAHAYIYGITS